mgnify:FL=1
MIVLSSGSDIDFDGGINPYTKIFKLKGVCIPGTSILFDEDERREKMQRISDDINVRYAGAFKALAKSERQDRENEILFGFERNLNESRR